MRNFASLAEFAIFTGGLIAEADIAKKHALEKAAKVIQTEAKRVIGTYDYGWPPLAASTVARKKGDTPLYETGELRESIEYNISGDTARIGSALDKALYQELGTHTIPPRSFLLGAATHKEHEVHEVAGKTFVERTFKP